MIMILNYIYMLDQKLFLVSFIWNWFLFGGSNLI